jgi:hypothetical protein
MSDIIGGKGRQKVRRGHRSRKGRDLARRIWTNQFFPPSLKKPNAFSLYLDVGVSLIVILEGQRVLIDGILDGVLVGNRRLAVPDVKGGDSAGISGQKGSNETAFGSVTK